MEKKIKLTKEKKKGQQQNYTTYTPKKLLLFKQTNKNCKLKKKKKN